MRGFFTHRRLIAALGLLAAGYLLLLATDPMGRNAASVVAPFLILAGIVVAATEALRKE